MMVTLYSDIKKPSQRDFHSMVFEQHETRCVYRFTSFNSQIRKDPSIPKIIEKALLIVRASSIRVFCNILQIFLHTKGKPRRDSKREDD